MRTRVTIVGEAPSRSSDPKKPFCGYSGKKLAEYAGLGSYEELAACTRLINVLQRWPGTGFAGEKGSRFPIVRARRAAKRIEFGPWEKVLIAGKRVAKAFGLAFADYFSWKVRRAANGEFAWFALVPHPSGCNHALNDERMRARMRRFLRRDVELPVRAARVAMLHGDDRRAGVPC